MKSLLKVFTVVLCLSLIFSTASVVAKGYDNHDYDKVISTFVPSTQFDEISDFYSNSSDFGTRSAYTIIWEHDGWVDTYVQPGIGTVKQAVCETSCHLVHGYIPLQHYSRAQLVTRVFGSVRKDSGREFGTGTSDAESGWGVWELVAKTFYGM